MGESMHALPVDEGFVHTAKARAVAEREMAVSAEQLFATLEDGPSWSKWVPPWSKAEPIVTRLLPAVQRQLLRKLERVAGERSVRA